MNHVQKHLFFRISICPLRVLIIVFWVSILRLFSELRALMIDFSSEKTLHLKYISNHIFIVCWSSQSSYNLYILLFYFAEFLPHFSHWFLNIRLCQTLPAGLILNKPPQLGCLILKMTSLDLILTPVMRVHKEDWKWHVNTELVHQCSGQMVGIPFEIWKVMGQVKS